MQNRTEGAMHVLDWELILRKTVCICIQFIATYNVEDLGLPSPTTRATTGYCILIAVTRGPSVITLNGVLLKWNGGKKTFSFQEH